MSDKQNPTPDQQPSGAVTDGGTRLGRRRFLMLSAQALGALSAGNLLPQALAATAPGESAITLATAVGNANARVLSQVCERILPTTDTPGAIAAGVPEFFAGLLNEVYLPSDTERFIGQLDAFNAATSAEYGTAFDELDSARQDARLLAMSADPDSAEAAFFVELRQLTVYGYYTSELGGDQRTRPHQLHGALER